MELLLNRLDAETGFGPKNGGKDVSKMGMAVNVSAWEPDGFLQVGILSIILKASGNLAQGSSGQ